MNDPSAEHAADDVLLLLTSVESPDVPLPSADEVVAVLTEHTEASLSAASEYMRRRPKQAPGAQYGYGLAVESLLEPATSHMLLSIRLLVWVAKRTGLTHAQVVAEVLAHTDVDPEG